MSDKKQHAHHYVGIPSVPNGRKMTRDEIRKRFDEQTAIIYSQEIPTWLPEYEENLKRIVEVMQSYFPSKGCFLDLGAGTASLSKYVLELFPKSYGILVDFSENMLEQVSQCLEGFQGRYETLQADFFSLDLPNESLDSIISSFAIHHGRGKAEYFNLYKKIFSWLRTPGIFICCDVVEGDNRNLTALNEKRWITLLRERGFSVQEAKKILSDYHREDSPLSLRNHLTLLIETGFSAADVIWKDLNFGIYVGVKE